MDYFEVVESVYKTKDMCTACLAAPPEALLAMSPKPERPVFLLHSRSNQMQAALPKNQENIANRVISDLAKLEDEEKNKLY